MVLGGFEKKKGKKGKKKGNIICTHTYTHTVSQEYSSDSEYTVHTNLSRDLPLTSSSSFPPSSKNHRYSSINSSFPTAPFQPPHRALAATEFFANLWGNPSTAQKNLEYNLKYCPDLHFLVTMKSVHLPSPFPTPAPFSNPSHAQSNLARL